MSMTDLPFVIPTTSKSVRFLLACLIRKLAKWEISWNELSWELDQQGTEAHYLKLLYHKELNESVVRTLFSQSVCPFTIDDCRHYQHIFKELSFGGHPFPAEGERTYCLELDSHFLFRGFSLQDRLDDLLGWPRDLAKIFFEYMETHSLPENFSKLTKGLGFKKWGEFSGKPYWIDSDKKIHYYRLDLEKKPKRCPFCRSTEVVDVIAGMPAFSELKGNEYIYGCCVNRDCPPPAWHCNHCGLFIWKTSDLFEDDL